MRQSLKNVKRGVMKSIFISAGHSYTDPGASGAGVSEADIVLEFRDLLANAPEYRGTPFRNYFRSRAKTGHHHAI